MQNIGEWNEGFLSRTIPGGILKSSGILTKHIVFFFVYSFESTLMQYFVKLIRCEIPLC